MVITPQEQVLNQIGSTYQRDGGSAFDRHCSHVVHLNASPEQVFARADEHAQLSSHMTRRSWMTGGGRMGIHTDSGAGRRLGSKIQLEGRMFGVRLSVEEVVTEYDPPRRKVWQTVGVPRLVVLESYRMGFEVTPLDHTTRLEVFLDYNLPRRAVSRWLGALFGTYYARWCTQKMATDLGTHFSRSAR